MILQALAELDRRQNATPGETPVADGYSKEKIGFELVLDAQGRLVDEPTDLRDTNGKKPEPRLLEVPAPVKRTSGVAANFLWDKAAYVLGMEWDDPKRDAKERAKRAARLPKEHAAFVQLHRERLAGTEDEGLQALLRFLERHNPASPDPRLPTTPEFLGSNLVFRLDGDACRLHERPAAKALLRRTVATEGKGVCLISGDPAPPARLHPAIKGVWGAQSSGASIVSFNQDAFTSYGKEQGANAPVSEAAAAAYVRALNGLLEKGSRRRVQIGDATTVFWAERDTPAESAMAWWLGAADLADADGTVDRDTTDRMLGVLEQLASGRAIDPAIERDRDVRFHVLGLAPNASRLSIRFWHTDTLGEIAKRFVEHMHDLSIKPTPTGRPPALWRLLVETAVERKPENVPKQIAGELARAVLTGGRYPRSLLTAVLVRIRADGDVNGVRAAICKAVLVRNARIDRNEGDRYVSLDPDNLDPAYRLGRLFAVLENAQRKALGENLNATIRDKYYAAASATPAAVFPLLIRGANNHLGSLRKEGESGRSRAFWIERRIGEILGPLGASFPRSFSLDDQGRFAIGYYHERFAGRGKAESPTDTTED